METRAGMNDAPHLAPRPGFATSRTGKPMVATLAARFGDSLLPHEAGGMDAPRLADAAAFTLDAMAQRQQGEPAVALESIGGSAGQRFLRLAVINDDMPFLVDSIAAAVAEQGLTIERLLHPVLPVRRDAKGRISEFPGTPTDGDPRESVIYLETERGDARQRRLLA